MSRDRVVLTLDRVTALALHAAVCEAIDNNETVDQVDRWALQRLRDVRRSLERAMWSATDRAKPGWTRPDG